MSSPPDVSVVIAAWNAADHIGGAIESALQQQGVEVEVLVADDASSDDTAGAVGRLADPRVSCVRLAQNGGPGVARNAAIERASGRWIAVLDADDYMRPGRLASLVALAEAEQADIAADNLWVEGPAGRALKIPEALDGGCEQIGLEDFVLNSLLFRPGRGYGYLKPIFSADFLRRTGLRYDPSLRIAEDFQLVLEALALGARYARSRTADYVYVTHSGSISHRLRPGQVEAMIDADQRFLARFDSRLRPQEKRAMRRHLASLEEGAAFVRAVDHLKAGRVGPVLRDICAHPTAARLFAMPVAARLNRLLGR